MMVSAVTAVLTAGGGGLAVAYAGDGPEPVETGYMVVEGASGAGREDCPDQDQAVLTSDGARL